MRVTLAEVRRLVAEQLSANMHARSLQAAAAACDAADDYVRSVIAGRPDGKAARRLQASASELESLSTWLVRRAEVQGAPMAALSRAVSSVAAQSGFWRRPVLVGRWSYVNKLQDAMDQVHRLRRAASG